MVSVKNEKSTKQSTAQKLAVYYVNFSLDLRLVYVWKYDVVGGLLQILGVFLTTGEYFFKDY